MSSCAMAMRRSNRPAISAAAPIENEEHDGGNDSSRSFHGNVLNMRSVICSASASVHNTTAASANFM